MAMRAIFIIGEVTYGRPPMGVFKGVSTACELACIGQGGEALPSPLCDPLFLPCARAVNPRPVFGVCRLTAATPHLVWGFEEFKKQPHDCSKAPGTSQ